MLKDPNIVSLESYTKVSRFLVDLPCVAATVWGCGVVLPAVVYVCQGCVKSQASLKENALSLNNVLMIPRPEAENIPQSVDKPIGDYPLFVLEKDPALPG